MFGMEDWLVATIVYCIVATITFLPVVTGTLKKIDVKKRIEKEGFKDTFNDADFSAEGKKRLQAHLERTLGALLYWKKRAEWHRRFHFYVLCWTLPISIVIPVMITFIDLELYSKLFLTMISLHSALILGFHRALKIESNYRAFKYGKSEFCDMLRRILDRPESFGATEEERLETYFIETERLRKYMRSAEVDNFPGLEEKQNLSQEDEKNGRGDEREDISTGRRASK